jgi:hypothetical protein
MYPQKPTTGPILSQINPVYTVISCFFQICSNRECSCQASFITDHLLLELLYSPCEPWPLFSLLNYSQSVGILAGVISSSQCLYLNTGQHKHRINTYTHQTSMPWVEFEPTITASERAKTVHALELGYRDRLRTIAVAKNTTLNNVYRSIIRNTTSQVIKM